LRVETEASRCARLELKLSKTFHLQRRRQIPLHFAQGVCSGGKLLPGVAFDIIRLKTENHFGGKAQGFCA
jgi:hypothetical protein